MNVPAGPWEAIAENETEPYKVVGQYVVASDLPCEDAWLIAAAPDLCDALSALIDDFGDAEGPLIDKAKAALAKARGETR